MDYVNDWIDLLKKLKRQTGNDEKQEEKEESGMELGRLLNCKFSASSNTLIHACHMYQ